MVVIKIIKRFLKQFLDPVMMGACSNVIAVLIMVMSIQIINVDVPDRGLTNKALTFLLVTGILLMIYFWILYVINVLKRWNADGFTFSLKLDEEDNSVEYVDEKVIDENK